MSARPRKACIVGQFGDPETAASGARVASLAEGLAGHGFEVTAIGVTATWARNTTACSQGIIVHHEMAEFGTSSLVIVRSSDGTLVARDWRTALRHIGALRAFTQRVFAWGHENRGGTFVLYGHRGELLLLAVLVARIRRCRTVLDVTEWFDRASRGSFVEWLSTLIAQQIVPRLVDHVTIIAEEIAEQLPETLFPITLPAMAPKHVTERAGLATARPKHSPSPDRFSCVFTGSEQGGLSSLVAALGGLSASHPGTRFQLKITGSHDSVGSPKRTGQLTVEYAGFLSRERYLALLDDADCLVIPGRRGTVKDYAFPNRFPEYLVSGVPTILSGYPAAARRVTHLEHAIILGTADTEELTRALETVLLDREEMRRMGERARTHALRAFDPIRLIAPLVAALEEARG